MTQMNEMPHRETWHLDKRVPISLILAIAIQTGAGGWYAATMANRVEFLERDVERQRVLSLSHGGSINDLERSLGRHDEKLNSILRILEDVKSDLDDFKEEQKEVLDKINAGRMGIP